MSTTIHVQIEDSSQEVLAAFKTAVQRGLMACGSTAEGYAKKECPVDTGRLRNSITHSMSDDTTVQIGTDVEYSIYVECGTGKYATTGGGTPKESWVYKGDDGKWHMGFPQKARPFLKPAVADHKQEYIDLIRSSLENA